MAKSHGCGQLQEHFAELTDPRRGKVTHPLLTIVMIAVCAMICGADDFVAIAQFGRLKRKWLAKFLDLSNGVPSHDRFNQVLAALSGRVREVSAELDHGTAGRSPAVVGSARFMRADGAESPAHRGTLRHCAAVPDAPGTSGSPAG
jgi:hypothetical protein